MPQPTLKKGMIMVYSPDGGAEPHTIANARDLINAGWTYNPNNPDITPASKLPRSAVPSRPEFRDPASLAQSIIDNAEGTKRAATATPPPYSSQPEEDEIGDDADEALHEAEAVVEAAAPAPEAPADEAKPTGRRGRGRSE
jgi:hypothetical protein